MILLFLVEPPRFGRRPQHEQPQPPTALIDPDATTCQVLSRVKDGLITRRAGGFYYDCGRPLTSQQLTALYFDGLLAVGFVTITCDPGAPTLETLQLTATGQAKLDELVGRCEPRTLTT
jgi:hypothetical protein